MNKAELAQLQARLDDSLSSTAAWATDDGLWQQAQECYHDLCHLMDNAQAKLPVPSRKLLEEYKVRFESYATSAQRNLYNLDLFGDQTGEPITPLTDLFNIDGDTADNDAQDDLMSDDQAGIDFETLFDDVDTSPPPDIPLLTASTKVPSPTVVFDPVPPELNPSYNIWDPYLDPKRREILVTAAIKWTHEVLIERYQFKIPACFPQHEYAMDVLYTMHQTWISAIKGADESREAYLKWIKDFEYIHLMMVKGHLGECFAPCINAAVHVDTRVGVEQTILENAMSLDNVDLDPAYRLQL
ncbi:hypothetical protein [Ferrimicrobium acidiphilum]|uniref:hypothetical protein n=1 Tax=Ferrimicrobium acidiphilum TaxID=121039 RepID=UPI0023F07375|nr:hypothetical protein [Ferrimicrobium acidiphilum]